MASDDRAQVPDGTCSPDHEREGAAGSSANTTTTTTSSSWFSSVPTPIKRVFDQFPRKTYPPNPVPRRADAGNDPRENRLYVFTDAQGAAEGAPSFNPQCLKWQAYLRFVNIPFRPVPSNNHASSTGSLPFLLPADNGSVGDTVAGPEPVPTHRLQKWAIEQEHVEEEQQLNARFDVYASLVDSCIRSAWLYTFYLDPVNFPCTAHRLYIAPATTTALVRFVLARRLQNAARAQLLTLTASCSPTSSPPASSSAPRYIDSDDIVSSATDALAALSTLLGNDNFFFGRPRPGLLDASVFAYTHLALDEGLGWVRNPLGKAVRRYENLVRHQVRLLEGYF